MSDLDDILEHYYHLRRAMDDLGLTTEHLIRAAECVKKRSVYSTGKIFDPLGRANRVEFGPFFPGEADGGGK